MKTTITAALYALLLSISPTIGLAATPTEPKPQDSPRRFNNITLLQPGDIIDRRATSDELIETIQAIQVVIDQWAGRLPERRLAHSCSVFVAIRPEKRFKTWSECKAADGESLDEAIRLELAEDRIATVSGLVLFSMRGDDADADALPKDWKASNKGNGPILIEDLANRAWPE